MANTAAPTNADEFASAVRIIAEDMTLTPQVSRQSDIARRALMRDIEYPAELLEHAKEADSYVMHEASDRLGILLDTFQTNILEHPSIVANTAWFTQAMDIAGRIKRLSDMVDAEHAGDDGEAADD